MIEVKNMTFRYPGARREVFNGLGLTIGQGCVCGLLGKNGEGKTTLLYLMCGLLHPQKGEVLVEESNSRKRSPYLLENLFLVAEQFDMPAVRLSEYVKVNRPFYPRFDEEMLHTCLKVFELEDDPHLDRLSMGQKKKAYISFALAANTPYLFMDEPTNGLDIPSKGQFRRVVANCMTPDRTILISTHQVHDVDTLLDHILILNKGKILLNQSVEQICHDYVFEYRMPNDMADAIYAEPTLQGNAVMAPRGDKPETPLNIELLFNALTQEKA